MKRNLKKVKLLESFGFSGQTVLAARKAAGHRNLAGTIAVIEDDDEDPDA
jgi:hypothetical protein